MKDRTVEVVQGLVQNHEALFVFIWLILQAACLVGPVKGSEQLKL